MVWCRSVEVPSSVLRVVSLSARRQLCLGSAARARGTMVAAAVGEEVWCGCRVRKYSAYGYSRRPSHSLAGGSNACSSCSTVICFPSDHWSSCWVRAAAKPLSIENSVDSFIAKIVRSEVFNSPVEGP